MQEELEELKSIFVLIRVKIFAEKYGFPYDHLRRVLEGKRKLTPKYYKRIKIALKEFSDTL